MVPATRRRGRGEGQPINLDKSTSNFLLVNAVAVRALSLSLFLSRSLSLSGARAVKRTLLNTVLGRAGGAGVRLVNLGFSELLRSRGDKSL